MAVYRDNCKVAQPLSTGKQMSGAADSDPEATPTRSRSSSSFSSSASGCPSAPSCPHTRNSRTFEFRVADCKGYVTVGEYEDGRPGEIFIRVSKQGSTLAGIMDAFAISVSHGLQYGVPLRSYVKALIGMRFEPAGMTNDPEIRLSTSLMDYLFRKLAMIYLPKEDRAELAIYSTDERMQPTLPGVQENFVETRTGPDIKPSSHPDAPLCMQCGDRMMRAGSCFACPSCGTTSGCS